MKQEKRRILVVTGLSGAGLSTALKSLEDLGYKAVDNIPIALVEPLLRQKEGQGKPLALGIDARTWDFSPQRLIRLMAQMKKHKNLKPDLVFVNCQDNILQQRFTETRRTHPLAVDRPVSDGVILERQMMAPLRKIADHVIDTSDLKAHELKRLMAGHFQLAEDKGLFISVHSFGFRNGIPREADLVFDVRFLDNPHWDPKLRPLSGLDAPVANKLRADPACKAFLKNLQALLGPLFPRYDHEGKHYLTIAIGCTGGRHRSVFVAEELHRWLHKKGFSSAVRHRDLEKWALQQLHAVHEDKRSNRKRRKAA